MKAPKICQAIFLLGLMLPASSLRASSPPAAAPGRSGGTVEGRGELVIEASLDGFEPVPLAVEANSHFPIIYHFEIGADSHPVHIRPFVGEGWLKDRKAAIAGLSKWTLHGLDTDNTCVLTLEWEHGRGYNFLSLMSRRMSLSIGFPYEALTVRDRLKIKLPIDASFIQPVFLGDASFQIVSHFLAGEDVRPAHVTVLAGKMFIDEKILTARLADAVFKGLGPEDFYVMTLHWVRAKGYTRLSVVGSRMSLSVRLLE